MGRFSSSGLHSRMIAARSLRAAACVLLALSVGLTFAADPLARARLVQPSDTLSLTNLQDQFAAVADRVAASVVAISASTSSKDSDDLLEAGELSPQRLTALLDRVTRTVGTGLVIDANGFILTNEHVVSDTEQIWV